MATNHINIALGANRQKSYADLQELAGKLGCTVADLVWFGAEAVLKNPPKDMPKSATARVGSARGFWVKHEKDANGKLLSASVIEVVKRADVEGATFYRYSAGDGKARGRAMNQAKNSAKYDMSLVGIKGDVKCTELADKEGKAEEGEKTEKTAKDQKAAPAGAAQPGPKGTK